jgi:DNA (cytosine-5)-methyltransferase 1
VVVAYVGAASGEREVLGAGCRCGAVEGHPVRYLSVCSGIEAATVAWHPLGWEPAAFSEIEKFPRAVLEHHYPHVPLHGDFTTIEGKEYGPIELLVGGTPCQDFSIAGLRAGIAGERGNLTLEFLRLASRMAPRWIVWENVPGVLSSDGGRALGSFLGGLGQLGYGFAYRVLDAQHFGLAQRRARVFVVGHLGDWRRAAAVLFERASLSGHPAPRREAGEIAPNSLVERPDRGGGNSEGQRLIASHEVAQPLLAKGNSSHRADAESYVAHALTRRYDSSEDGCGRGTPLVPVAFNWQSGGDGRGLEPKETTGALSCQQTPAIAFSAKDHGGDAGDISPTLRAGGHAGSHANGGVMPAVALYDDPRRFDARGIHGGFEHGELHPQLNTVNSQQILRQQTAVRRLTPRECERLQGFPDDYTLVAYRGRPAADGPRYKALGNSMAVPVMRWIGERIAMVESLTAEAKGERKAMFTGTKPVIPIENEAGKE